MKEGRNNKIRQKSNKLLTAITTPIFDILLSIMAKYSSKFKIVSTILQGIGVYLQQVTRHIQNLLSILEKHTEDCKIEFSEIKKLKEIALKIDLELSLSQRTSHQIHRDNYPIDNVEDYFRQSLFIRHLKSIINY